MDTSMHCCIFLRIVLLATSLSASSEVPEETKELLLNAAAKQLILIKIHSQKWEEITSKISNEETTISERFVEETISVEHALAGLYERYLSIQINMICWHCALVLKLHTDADARIYAIKCAELGSFMSWYNENLTAKLYIDALKIDQKNMEESDSRVSEYNIYDTATKIDNILGNLKIINEEFMKADFRYDNIFENLRNAGANLEETEAKPIVERKKFFQESWYRLEKIIGQDYLHVINYMNAFMSTGASKIENFEDLQPHGTILILLWNNIKNLRTLERKYSEVKEILNLEVNNCITRLSAFNIDVSTSSCDRKWIINKKINYFVDYELEFI